MLKLGCVKSTNWASGTFKLLFCLWCYSNCFSDYVMLANTLELPSYANVSSSWNINMSSSDILYSPGYQNYPSFTLGWIVSETYKFGIYYWDINEVEPAFVWSINLDQKIQFVYGATLELTLDGDLVLRDAKSGGHVWSTNTSGLLVYSMHLKGDGNLVLLNRNGDIVWESYRHPNTSPPNKLYNVKQGPPIGQRMASSDSLYNSTGTYYLDWGIDGLHAYVVFENNPQEYKFWDYETYNSKINNYAETYIDIENGNMKYRNVFSFLFLDVDGHLKWVNWNYSTYEFWDVDNCLYPTVCGEYGICMGTICSCPTGDKGSLNYFKPLVQYDSSLGCTLFTPISCSDNSKDHGFLELEKVTYFDSTPSLVGVDVASCKRACLKNCSCKAVFFHHFDDPLFGNCTLPSEILTLMDVSQTNLSHKVLTFLKVQNNASTKGPFERRIVIYVSIISLIFLIFVTGALCFAFNRVKNPSRENDSSLDILVDTISRFSIESLKLATQNFQTKLGRGGYGSVYEGTLVDDTKVAVKCLESCRQGTKEFLAEVNTIGSIHHFNLVKLIGFCDEGFNRLLVYEYMCNGSLDKWIFNHDICETLTWNIRQRIIEGMAAGLEYLHEHCTKNVIHFDIKPENILLDKDFNVKISDFGLAKMVDRDESQVMTVVRGTPGYMAPELINSRVISVKVDVYSLGVVILEIVCGRRNFGSPEEDTLTNLVKAKADQDQLSDLIDARVQDMQRQKGEVVNMMKIAIWCLQPHFIRPTMPKVMKALQDLSDSEALNNLSDLTMTIETTKGEATNNSSFRPMDSILSGPR